MSAEDGKVCCNCRHCIREDDEALHTHCYCEVEKRYLGYGAVMEWWCRHWAKEKESER